MRENVMAKKQENAADEDKRAAKKRYEKEIERLQVELAHLQAWVKTSGARIVIIFEGRDAAGKGGVIRRITERVSPRVFRVVALPAPTEREKSQMYIQRYFAHLPAAGEIMIFDRSHYEDVLAVRVNQLKPEKVWRKRYRHIRDFEHMLSDEGTIILKFFLHIDQETQKKRLQERLDVPAKNWKFDQSDLVARSKWVDYILAYEEVFAETARPHAPWYIIPANKKWARNLLAARIIVACLDDMHLSYPAVDYDPAQIVID